MSAAEAYGLLRRWCAWYDKYSDECEEAEYTDTDVLWSALHMWREEFRTHVDRPHMLVRQWRREADELWPHDRTPDDGDTNESEIEGMSQQLRVCADQLEQALRVAR